MFRFLKSGKILVNLVVAAALLSILGLIVVGTLVIYYGRNLPDHHQLSEYNPPTITRLYANNGQVLAEYATEKRLYVPIEAIPKRIINAFIAAEDKNFYDHPGVDLMGILRAAIHNVLTIGQNRNLSGGSTITQQVVKNFLLNDERSLERKIREAILAFRITKTFSKERILELYLNQIYLGNRSYGVAAAALNYFNKSIGELTIEEAAVLASLPKAPSFLDPFKYKDRALERRNWVISRMEEEGFINEVEAVLASAQPITLERPQHTDLVNAGFFTDTVKQELIEKYGETSLYHEGYAVRTTLDPKMQHFAEKSLLKGLREYDHRHGWRGPLAHIDTNKENWQDDFFQLTDRADLGVWSMAVVTDLTKDAAHILLKNKDTGLIPLNQLKWARRFINRNHLGSAVSTPSDVLAKGDIIAVNFLQEQSGSRTYTLEQIPQINGGIIALDPHTGQVLAMVGGYYYGDSQFNRVVQAKRQPGSAFKPFVYLAALENGFTPNSIIVDEEIQLSQGNNEGLWKPQNHSDEFYGATTLRTGVEKSRNVMTVRLTQLLGIDHVIDVAKRFGIYDNPPRNLSMVLGSTETTLLGLTNAYAMLVNGGKKITPSLIERVQNRKGLTIYKRDNRLCQQCWLDDGSSEEDNNTVSSSLASDTQITPPYLSDERPQITDAISAYQITSFLEGVIKRGTATRARRLGRTLGGKTGTTNDSIDSWFIGFSPDLVVGVYTGFDQPASLGTHEYGSSVALPIWIDFMEQALKDVPDIPFRRPDGVKLVKIDLTTGLLPSSSTKSRDIIYEAFKNGTQPTSSIQPTRTHIFRGNNKNNDNNGGNESFDDLDSGTIY